MTALIITALLIGIAYVAATVLRNRREIATLSERFSTYTVNAEEEMKRQRASQERLDKAIAKQEARLQKLEYQIQQAEADREHAERQITQYSDLLREADERMAEIDRQLAINEAMRDEDGSRRLLKEKERIRRSIIGLENKVYTAEKNHAKAVYTRETAQREMDAA